MDAEAGPSSWRCPLPHCSAAFTSRSNRDRHIRTRHQSTVRASTLCPECGKRFSRNDNFKRHLNVHKKGPSGAEGFQNEKESNFKGHEAAPTNPRKKRKVPTTEEEKIETLPNELREVYSRHLRSIKTHKRPGRYLSTHTIFWDPVSDSPDWDSDLLSLFEEQTKRFKINFSHSFLLRHKESGKLTFFHASVNNHSALETPRLIQSKQDFLSFLEEINDQDILTHVRKERPNSHYSVEKVMATSFYVYHLSDFPIGCACEDVPSFLLTNPFLHTLQKDENHSHPYRDGLCFFRCLALHRGASLHSLNKPTLQLFQQCYGHPYFSSFPGVTLTELDGLEDKFKLNIDVFEFDESQSPPILVPFRRSAYKYTDTLRLLHYKRHFMHIIDIDKLGHSLACQKCHKLFQAQRLLTQHEKTCQGSQIKYRYPGGVYNPPQNILQKLHSQGIDIDTTFVFPFRASFDFEVFFSTDDLPKTKTEDTTYIAQHIPLSVSVASNVPGYVEPKCFVSEGNPQELVSSMILYLESISDQAYMLLREHFEQVFEQLDDVEHTQRHCPDSLNIPISSLREQFESYLRELPVIGFNTGRYDLAVIKTYLLSHFCSEEEEEEEKEEVEEVEPAAFDVTEEEGNSLKKSKCSSSLRFVVKKTNNYMCIATDKLRFLDIMNFLAPGFSYAKYLKAFDVSETKFFFPYEHITSLEKLQETVLPPHSAFFSTIKNTNITAEEYAYCQYIWKRDNMQSLKDFLIFYNNSDVKPFLTALERQVQIYQNLGIDLLKDGISVPGITLKYLFQTLEDNQTYFSLFNEAQKDLHSLLRQNMTGGPSIVFHRYHEKGKTYLRNNPDKPVESIQGFDANALYLYAIQKEMPTEYPIVRKKENNFKAEQTDPFGKQAREWLEYTSHSQGIYIQHKFNNKKKQLGRKRIRVDGWHSDTHTAFQFHGCLFHGHDCHLTQNKTINPFNGKSLQELKENTQNITRYLREEVGVKVIEMYECEWKRERRSNPVVSAFIQKHLPEKRLFSFTSELAILKAISSGMLFGLVQCDIAVPDHLKEHFAELQPIFKNCEIGREDIGPFMKEYAEKHKMLNQPRRTLVGSYFGNQILVATPLLKWYVEHGLQVSNITLIIEYQPKACFKAFGENVSKARREGDKDAAKSILADTFKLLGNSAYGKVLTNVEKHREIHYVSSPQKVSKLVNTPRFQKLTELTENLVEVEMKKKRVEWNLPIQIGFFVYQYAKLRMLEFFYDFVDRFVSTS